MIITLDPKYIKKQKIQQNIVKEKKNEIVAFYVKGRSPTTRNYASEPALLGPVAGVNELEVQ